MKLKIQKKKKKKRKKSILEIVVARNHMHL